MCVCVGGTLIETVKICDQCTSQYASMVSVDCLRFMTEYIATTFLQHFRLYQHVFQHKQDRLVIKLQESVSIPPSLPSFTGSIPRDIWEYEAKQRVLDEQEEQRKQCDEVKQLQVRESDQETLKQAYTGLQDQPAETFDRQVCTLFNLRITYF